MAAISSDICPWRTSAGELLRDADGREPRTLLLGAQLTDDELCDAFMLMMLAGLDTVESVLKIGGRHQHSIDIFTRIQFVVVAHRDNGISATHLLDIG